MSYQVLARKWRPRFFDEMVGQALPDNDGKIQTNIFNRAIIQNSLQGQFQTFKYFQMSFIKN